MTAARDRTDVCTATAADVLLVNSGNPGRPGSTRMARSRARTRLRPTAPRAFARGHASVDRRPGARHGAPIVLLPGSRGASTRECWPCTRRWRLAAYKPRPRLGTVRRSDRREICAGISARWRHQAESERKRRAKLVDAEVEFQASEPLNAAANVMSVNPVAVQLRFRRQSSRSSRSARRRW